MKLIAAVVFVFVVGCTTARQPTDLELLKQAYGDLEALDPVLARADATVPKGFMSKEQIELRRFRGILHRRIRELEKKEGFEQPDRAVTQESAPSAAP